MDLDREVPCIYGPVAVALPNGGLEVFEIGKDNQLYHLWTAPDPYHWGNNGQYGALGAQIKIKKKKIGLALGGGASKGDFQLGAVRYLYEVKKLQLTQI